MTQSKFIESQISRQRLGWVDYAKGIGIFLVVLGHTIRGLATRNIIDPSGWFIFVDQWIYSFHMALFFFLSGLFIHRAASKSLPTFLLRQIQLIVYPYFLWSILQGILQAVINQEEKPAEAISNLWRIVYEPIMQFWFLYVLFIISVLYAISVHFKLSSKQFFALTILLYCSHIMALYLGNWGIIYQVRVLSAYLALGVVFSQTNLMSGLKIKPQYLILITILGFLLVGWGVQWQLSLGVTLETVKPLIALTGITASIALANLMAQYQVLGFVENWGKLSLQIYLIHTIVSAFVRTILQKIFHINEPITHIVLETWTGIYVPIAITFACQKIQFPYLFSLRKI